ncbi:MAG TPA: hypothetical protein GX707_00415, partial [Epulopiscium sp.]|nr:hypothetical protein [Candidatus Epulonipiscium sp.]
MNFIEKKLEFDNKIRVFISSRCGEKKYDDIRMKLRRLIEDTGLAKVYVFEGGGPSTLTTEQDYLYGVDDSDVCIFLIDNADGVPEGVLKEYQRAKAKSKKSLYIFCNENQREATQIQKEITGPRGPKYYIVNSFKEFISQGYKGLINDIGEIYTSYCKGRLIDPEFSTPTGTIEEIEPVASESFDKQIFKSIDKTKSFIKREIFSREDSKVEETCDLDTCSVGFLKVLFGYQTIREFNSSFLFDALKEVQSGDLHKVVIERWKAIQYYWLNDLEKAIEYENEALKLARELRLSNWLIQDILIDLRNLYFFNGRRKNKYIYTSSAHKELDENKSALYYPLLDRYEKSLYEEITNQIEKDSMKSPYTVTLGSSIGQYGDFISSIYIMAIFNGSLTHILRTIERIKSVAFSLCKQYSDWEFRTLLLKTAIPKGNKKEVKGITDLFNDVYGKMNADDSRVIYEFSRGNPISYQKKIALLHSFQHLGYFFSEEYYLEVLNEIMEIINDWMNTEDMVIELGYLIFDAIKENILRLDNNQVVIDIVMKVFHKGLGRFYDEALAIIAELDYKELEEENIIAIVRQLEALIEEKQVRTNYSKLKEALLSVCKQNNRLTKNLREKMKRLMPDFYQSQYALETYVKSQMESEEYINRYISEIKDRNETQGKNGRYSGYSDNPYKIIENIICINEIKLNHQLIDSIISTCKETLYSRTQTLDAKVEATNLISFMRLISEEDSYDFKPLINQMAQDEELIFSGKDLMFFQKSSKSTLYFNFIMMKLVFNFVGLEEIVELLSSYNKLEVFEKLEALKTVVSIFKHGKAKYIDEKIILLFLQFSLGLSNDKNHGVRYFAVQALLH